MTSAGLLIWPTTHHVRVVPMQGSEASSFRDSINLKPQRSIKIKAEVRCEPFSGDDMEAESSRGVGLMGHSRGVRFECLDLEVKRQG